MRRRWISNIYVIDHKARPEDEGKVFLYSYPKTIYEMLKEKREPTFADQKAFNPFNFWQGANFRLRVRKKDGFPNYDSSEFEAPGPFLSDEELNQVYGQLHPLAAEVTPDKFKPYDELKRKLEEVLGASPKAASPWEAVEQTQPSLGNVDATEDEAIELFQSFVANRTT
jgi:hypothetical protein